jgi:energy-converting hydrogenase Eha subunit E
LVRPFLRITETINLIISSTVDFNHCLAALTFLSVGALRIIWLKYTGHHTVDPVSIPQYGISVAFCLHEKTLHFTDSTSFLGFSLFRSIRRHEKYSVLALWG